MLEKMQILLAEELLHSQRIVCAENERKARAEADAAEADRDTKLYIKQLVEEAKAASDLPAPKGGGGREEKST